MGTCERTALVSTGSLVFAVLDGEKLIRTSARSSGSTGSASANCDVTGSTIKTWATEISQYIKSIDSNHLVGLGDEGWFEEANPPSYPYAPSVGINFTSNLEVETLDFGTVHLYPEVSSKNTHRFGSELLTPWPCLFFKKELG